MGQSKKKMPFEQALAELQKIVERLEKGELELEESLVLYQKGMELYKACAQQLDATQAKLQKLTQQDGQWVEQEMTAQE